MSLSWAEEETEMCEKYLISVPQEDMWDSEEGKFFNESKEKILLILKEQKISLSEARYLFNNILSDIERHNPVIL